MQLRHLKHTKCPACNAPLVTDAIEGHHTNGQQFERQQFKCGSEVRWVPNFSREEISRPCPHSPESKARDTRRRKLLGDIRCLCRGYDDPEDVNFLNRLLSGLPTP
jgi:hypothetical protein